MIRTITSYRELLEDASGQTLVIPDRFNPALPLTERFPTFTNKRQVMRHIVAVRGQVAASDCFRDPIVLAKSNVAALRLFAVHH